jgi:hypothetical protein
MKYIYVVHMTIGPEFRSDVFFRSESVARKAYNRQQ